MAKRASKNVRKTIPEQVYVNKVECEEEDCDGKLSSCKDLDTKKLSGMDMSFCKLHMYVHTYKKLDPKKQKQKNEAEEA